MEQVNVMVFDDTLPENLRRNDPDDNLAYISIRRDKLMEWFREKILPSFRGDDNTVSDEGLLDEWLDEYTADETMGLYDWLVLRPIRRPKVPLVVHYSFDSEVPVYYFDSEEEAKKELKRQFEEEKRIDLEENGKIENEDVRFDVADDWSWASITNIINGNEPDDVTEWCVGTVKSTDGGMTLSKFHAAETADTRLYDWLSPQGCESYRDVKIAPAAFFMAYPKYYSGINTSTLSKGKKTFLLDFGDHYSEVRHDPDDGKKLDYLSWVRELWSAFGDIPLDGDSDDIDISFLHFPAGTNRFEIWSWFQETFDIGIDMLQDYC